MKPALFVLTALGLILSPGVRAEDAPKPADSTVSETKPHGDKAKDPVAEEQKKRFSELRNKASEDPAVKAALDAARAAQSEALTQLYDKMLELDPSLAPMIEKEKAKAAGRKKSAEKAKNGKQASDEGH